MSNELPQVTKMNVVSGQKYMVKITSITDQPVKQVRKKDNQYYQRYKIYMEDRDRNGIEAEFLSDTYPQTALVLNVMQWVHVDFISNLGTPTISPTEPAGSAGSSPLRQAAAIMSSLPVATSEDNSPPVVRTGTYGSNVGGKAIVFAMGFAKDLKVAEISKRPEGYKVSDEDIDEVIQWASLIAGGIVDRLGGEQVL